MTPEQAILEFETVTLIDVMQFTGIALLVAIVTVCILVILLNIAVKEE